MTESKPPRRNKAAAIFAGVAMLGAFIALPNDFIDFMKLISGTADQPSSGLAAPTTTTAMTELSQLELPKETPTTTAARPAPEPQVEEPADDPVTTKPTAKPTRGGSLIITIRMGDGGKIGVAEYRSGATPGANVDVFDDVGQLNAGCYPSWVLSREGQEVRKSRNGRCTSGGITMFNFGDSLKSPGTYRLDVTIATDSGQSGASSVDFTVS